MYDRIGLIYLMSQNEAKQSWNEYKQKNNNNKKLNIYYNLTKMKVNAKCEQKLENEQVV